MRLLSSVSLAAVACLIGPAGTFAASVLTSVSISSQTTSALLPSSNFTYIVTVSRMNNGNLDAYLTATGLPEGATASFSPSMVHLSGSTPTSETAELTISTVASLASCSNSFTVTATDGASFNHQTCAGTLMLGCATRAPVITSCGVLPGGSFQLVCSGSPNQPCLIQATTNLTAPAWSTIGTNTADGTGFMSYIDADAKNYPARFYRTAVVACSTPVIHSVTASPNAIWPPNHKMIAIQVHAVVTDTCGPATWKIVSVTSNEPVDVKGSGHTAAEWLITGDHTVKLLADRSGKGSGRIYTITIKATDVSGNIAEKTVTVSVPHDQSKKK